MISLYIHIPFCATKCAYCSFNSFPISQLDNYPLTTQRTSELRITDYITSLKKEIDYYAEKLSDKEIKTLYFWWGTPSRIGIDRIIDIIDHLQTKFYFEHIAELSIELNPNPMDEVLNFVDTINKKYKDFPRVRFSFGIQSLDDEVLQMTWRAYNFTQITEFLRELVKHKKEHTVFNFDFIAFGKFQVSKLWNKQLRHEFKRNFLQDFLNSGYADSISLYTLEGIRDKDPGTRTISHVPYPTSPYHGTDDEIMEEFMILKWFLEDAGYQRYEISNFAHAGKASIHNMVYWNMENYLWLGLSASSFFNQQGIENNWEAFKHFNISTFQPFGIRRTNTWDIKKYIEGKRIDEQQFQTLNESDVLIEEFFLRLRTREGLLDIKRFASVLVPNYELLITKYKWAWLLTFDGVKLRLTDEGMNVYNNIITDLLQKL
jgi:oxygen-independent coproporphyrinogen III oxidase